jgi:hypothetical protein
MIVRNLSTVKNVEWGNGLSRRFLLEDDGFGYTVTDRVRSRERPSQRHRGTIYSGTSEIQRRRIATMLGL